MEILVWALGVISALLLSFMGWIAIAVIDIKKSIAVIDTKLSQGDKRHDDFDARISHLEEQISSVVTDIAVIKSQHRENHET
jgi:hypothetical protein